MTKSTYDIFFFSFLFFPFLSFHFFFFTRTALVQFLFRFAAVWRNEMECKREEGCKILKRFGRSGWKCVCVCVCVTVKETALSFLITDNKSLQRHLSQAGLCWERDSQIGFLSLSVFFLLCTIASLYFSFPHFYENGSAIPIFVILYFSSRCSFL